MKRYYLIITALLSIVLVNGQPTIDECELDIVETIPNGMIAHELNNTIALEPFEANILDTTQVYLKLIANAKRSIKIASFYWSLTENDVIAQVNKDFKDPDNSQQVGQRVLDSLKIAAKERDVAIEIVTDNSMAKPISFRSDLMEIEKFATVHYLNATRLFGQGILHTKFILVDDEEFYLGSANMDWRSLTQVKEIGFYLHECPKLSNDLDRIFAGYKRLATSVNNLAGPATNNLIEENERHILSGLVSEVAHSEYSQFRPLIVKLNNKLAKVHLAAAPEYLAGVGRSVDLNAIRLSIKKAREFVYLSAMDYSEFSYPNFQEWPALSEVLEEAKERGVDVKILTDSHKIFNKQGYKLKKAGIDFRGFIVPKCNEYQNNLPNSRVYHGKYIVTDQTVIITTQNLTPNYFNATLGVSLVIDDEPDLTQKMKHLFERDYMSSYASVFVPKPWKPRSPDVAKDKST